MGKEEGLSADSVERKEGLYWVKFNSWDDWTVSEWSGSFWWTFGSEEGIFWKPFEIDERQICRS